MCIVFILLGNATNYLCSLRCFIMVGSRSNIAWPSQENFKGAETKWLWNATTWSAFYPFVFIFSVFFFLSF